MLQEEAEEDVTVFDRTSLLASGGGSTRHGGQKKGFSTFALCGAFFGVGLALAIPGPTLNYLKCNVGATLKTISYIFPARSLGYLIGSLLGGFLFDKLVHKGNKLVCSGLILAALTVGAAPWTSSLSFLCIFLALTSISMGFLDTGGNVILLRIWEKESGPYMQALHFAFGVGACISPLVAAPFLSSTGVSCNVSEVLPYGNVSTIEPLALSPMHKRQFPAPTKTLGLDFLRSHTKGAAASTNVSSSLSTAAATPNVTSASGQTVTTAALKNITLVAATTTIEPQKPKITGDVVSHIGGLDDANGRNVGDDVDLVKQQSVPIPPSKPMKTSLPTTVSIQISTNPSLRLTDTTENNSTSFNETLGGGVTPDSSNATLNTTSAVTSVPTKGETTSTPVSSITGAVATTSVKENSISDDLTSTSSSTTESSTSTTEGTSKEMSNTTSETGAAPSAVKATPTILFTSHTTPTTSKATPTTLKVTPTTSKTALIFPETTPTTLETTPITTLETTPTTSETTPTMSETTPTISETTPITSKTTPTTSKTTPTTSKTTPTTSKAPVSKPSDIKSSNSDLSVTPPPSGGVTKAAAAPQPEYPKPGSANSTLEGDDRSLLRKAEDALMSISSVQFSYLVIAIVMLVFGLLFCCLPENGDRSRRRKSENDLHEVAEVMMAPPLSYRVKLMTAVFIFFFLYVGTEVSYGQFVATFSIHHSNFTERQGAYLTAVYWGMFALARGMCVPLARCLSPTTMLTISIAITVCSSVGLTIATAAVHSVGALWVLSGSLGVGMAAIFPTGVLWVEGYIKVTSKMAAVFVCASALGEMAIPAIVGYFIDLAGPLTLMYTTLVCVIGCMLTFVSMCCFVSTKTNEYRQVGLSETANGMNMQQFEFSDSDETDSEPILFKRNGASKMSWKKS